MEWGIHIYEPLFHQRTTKTFFVRIPISDHCETKYCFQTNPYPHILWAVLLPDLGERRINTTVNNVYMKDGLIQAVGKNIFQEPTHNFHQHPKI